MSRPKPMSAVPALLLLAVVFTLASGAPSEKQRVRTLTGNLVCTCGCANIIVASCDCGQAAEMRKEVAALVKAGKTDAEIYQAFEKRYGPGVLGAPKLEGFNVLAWVLPFAGLALGAVIVVMVVRKLHPKTAEPEFEPAPVQMDEKYRQLLEEELSE
ncbi:MAG: cytochrome c-type biogenesis protein CcmH [Acidobacteriota bacterium]